MATAAVFLADTGALAGFFCAAGVCANIIIEPTLSSVHSKELFIITMNYIGRLLSGVILLAAGLAGETVKVTILATTDLHGHIFPYDYFTQTPAAYGLAKIATLVKQARREAPEAILVDAGDTIQGSPLESLYQAFRRTGKLPPGVTIPERALGIDPMMLVMNAMRYDAMVVGNHEFNYGVRNLEEARRVARFAWISANTLASGPNTKGFVPYIEKTVGGVRVAVVGLTTPSIPAWEKPENYRGYTWEAPVEAMKRLIAIWGKNKPDLVVVAAHGGINKIDGRENFAWQVGEVEGVDAVIFGHSHGEFAELFNANTLMVQPKNYGASLGKVEFEFSRQEGGKWKMESRRGTLLKVSAATEADEEILSLGKPYHEATEQYLSSPVARAPVELSAANGRFEDSALVDAIHEVQLHYTKADVSLSALFNPRLVVHAGPVTVREAAALYVYDNTLYKVEGTGKMLKAALENAARFFESCPTPACDTGNLLNNNFAGFNYDMAEGVSYEVDLTRPVGERIRQLMYRGKPLAMDEPLTIAVNSYRAAGSAGYDMFKDAKVVWQSTEAIRDLIIGYYGQKKLLPSQSSNNWRIVPATARERLVKHER
ncbi:MAG: bifunctional metallophosphatase/5'-nucleotidase [Acidobacteriota bacterium]